MIMDAIFIMKENVIKNYSYNLTNLNYKK